MGFWLCQRLSHPDPCNPLNAAPFFYSDQKELFSRDTISRQVNMTDSSEETCLDIRNTPLEPRIGHPRDPWQHESAKKLRSKETKVTTFDELALAFKHLGSDEVDLTPFLPPASLVARRASEMQI